MALMRRKRCATLIVMCGVAASLGAPSGSVAAGFNESKARPAETLVRGWHLSHAHGVEAHGIWVAVVSGFCLGERRPHIDHVKVVERRSARGRSAERAIITVFEHYPKRRDSEAPFKDLGLTLERFVPLGGAVEKLSLYDGSSKPPRLVTRRSSG